MRTSLTAPNGAKVEIKPDAISALTPNDGTWGGSFVNVTKTVLRVDGENHAVRETIDEIKKLETELEQKSR